ncbi:hypothetical protein V6Z11_A07G248100 [Gossypium hirsutum]
MDKMKLAQWGEKLKTGGAQMSRMVSGKMKEILQGPTPESKLVDEATLETLEEPNWGMNMRIWSMINSEEFNGTEIVRAIKKKISGKNATSQRLSLDLLEACTVNCEKVASEVASEKVLEEMVKIIQNPQTYHQNREKAFDLIRGWGQSDDLAYLPVFHQTYMPLPPPENYPANNTGLQGNDFAYNYGSLSVEQKKELFEVTQNSLEVLSSILSTGTEPKPAKDELTESMLEKCKQSQLAIHMIIESISDDDGILFEALNLNDELQQVISKFEGLETGSKFDTAAANPAAPVETDKESTVGAALSAHDKTKTSASMPTHNETKMSASPKADGIESSIDMKTWNEN